MIQITAYLRTKEDHSKWKLLQNKTEWLHDRLNEMTVISSSDAPMTPKNPGMLKTVFKDNAMDKRSLTPAQKADLEVEAETRRRMGL